METENDDELSDTEQKRYVFVGHSETRPDDEWAAIMECAPHEWPEPSRRERLQLRDVIADAIDGLTDEGKWIFEGLFIRRASLRELAREIAVPKTTLARRRDALLVQLRDVLLQHPEIKEYLDNGST